MPDQTQKFQQMDGLASRNVPFFFMVDFLVENIEVFVKEDLEKKGLLIDFPNFTNANASHNNLPKIVWKPKFESIDNFAEGFNTVQDALKKGNSYLANYTRKTEVETNLSLEEIFHHSSAKYKLLYPEKFVLFSPETFVRISKNTISTEPMKGTINAEIPNAAEVLKTNRKELAEHYTVVDLLRNDLSIIADNVKVTDFQRLDEIRTSQRNLYAMSSEICGEIKPEFRGKIGSILQRLLPAGSILGAPKKKTLEIILKAEQYDRGYYTGVCGWYDGEILDSCVMIRFVEKENGKLYFKSGGGITHLSNLAEEYQEMKNKVYVPIF